MKCFFPAKKNVIEDDFEENSKEDTTDLDRFELLSYQSEMSSYKSSSPKKLEKEDTEEETKDIKIENEISIDKLNNKHFDSRDTLSREINQWASEHRFSVAFNQRERTLVKEDVKISVLECSDRLCPFYLEFKTSGEGGSYILTQYCNSHNHKLNKYNTTKDITQEIKNKIKQLKDNTKDNIKLTNLINNEFKTNFSEYFIRYQIKKMFEEEFGSASEDAKQLLDLISIDAIKRNYFYKKELDQNNKLLNICFITNRMQALANHYTDVFIVDATHKTNRFNLPLLDIVVIDSNGKTCTCFVALLKDQTQESYRWALGAFKSQLKNNPRVIISDEEESLISGKNL